VRSADGLATVSRRFTGLSWLFMGAANSDAKLYDDEIQAIAKKYPDQFRVDYALSREQKNKSGGEGSGFESCGLLMRVSLRWFMRRTHALLGFHAAQQVAHVAGHVVPHPAGKMYIQDKVEEYADEVFDLLVRFIEQYPIPCLGTCHCQGGTPAELLMSALCAAAAPMPVVALCACVMLLCICVAGQRRAHLLLRAQGHDARHPGNARAGVKGALLPCTAVG
jgi:Oxidoreductase NAD-binding domain